MPSSRSSSHSDAHYTGATSSAHPAGATPSAPPGRRRKRARALRAIREVVVTVVIALAVLWAVKVWRARGLLEPGSPLPILHVEDLQGNAVTLPRPGHALLLHLWAPW